MNCWLGSRDMNSGVGPLPAEPGYRTFVMENETALIGTATLWTFADENEATIDDPWWLVTMNNSMPFASFPATRHARGYNLSFADGHVERWNLLDPNTTFNPSKGSQQPISPLNTDWLRLKQASSVQLSQ